MATLRQSLTARRGLFAVSALAVLGIALVGRSVFAANEIGDTVILVFASFLNVLVGFVGQLLLIMVSALIWVAQYNGFVDSVPVVQGWSIVRDVANMIFIMIMLLLSFGTILGSANYSYQGRLSKLLIMAIVLNFSRTICGLIIDVAQVVMLTFVYGFKEAAGGNFADALKITKLMQIRSDVGDDAGITAWSIAVAMLLALVMVVISLFVVLVMTLTLAMRIVWLWLLVVISPLAFALRDVPGNAAKGIYSKWWGMFTSNVLVGPVLAFFLWLSLVSVSSPNFISEESGFQPVSAGAGNEVVEGSLTEAFKDSEIQSFIIAICLLLGGLKMANDIGAEAMKTGSSMASKVSKKVVGAAKAVGGAGLAIGGAAAGVASDRLGATRLYEDTKSKALKAGMGIPLAKSYFGEKLGKHRGKLKEAGTENEKWLKNLKPEERAKFENNKQPLYTMSAADRNKQKLALNLSAEKLLESETSTDKDRAKYGQLRAKLLEMAETDDDKKALKDLKDRDEKRPDLILDRNADAATQEEQAARQRRVAGGLSDDQVRKLPASAYGSADLMMGLDATKIAKNWETMQENYAKMEDGPEKERMGQFLSQIAAENEKLASARGLDGRLLNDSQKRMRLENFISDKQSAIFAPHAYDRKTAAERLAESASDPKEAGMLNQYTSREIANAVSVASDPEALKNLVQQLEYRKDSIKTFDPMAQKKLGDALMSKDVGSTALRLAAGVDIGKVFPGMSTESKFSNVPQYFAFDDLVEKDKAAGGSLAAALSDITLSKSNGVNDVTVTLINKMNLDDIKQMATNGNSEGAEELMAAVEKMAEMQRKGGTDRDTFIDSNKGNVTITADLEKAMQAAVAISDDTKNRLNPIVSAKNNNARARGKAAVNRMLNRKGKKTK